MYSCDFAACPAGAGVGKEFRPRACSRAGKCLTRSLPDPLPSLLLEVRSSSRLADVEYVSLSLFLELAAPEDSANGRVRLSSSRFACSLDGYACHGDETTVSICVRT